MDIDRNGTLDIVTAIDERLFALVARGDGAFEARDLGIMATTELLDLAAEDARRGAPRTPASPLRLHRGGPIVPEPHRRQHAKPLDASRARTTPAG